MFDVCNVKCLFKWFIYYFILLYSSSENKEKLDFSVIFIGVRIGCNDLISFQVGMLIIFDSAPESIKKSISRSGG